MAAGWLSVSTLGLETGVAFADVVQEGKYGEAIQMRVRQRHPRTCLERSPKRRHGEERAQDHRHVDAVVCKRMPADECAILGALQFPPEREWRYRAVQLVFCYGFMDVCCSVYFGFAPDLAGGLVSSVHPPLRPAIPIGLDHSRIGDRFGKRLAPFGP
jgi:hypothetical protein